MHIFDLRRRNQFQTEDIMAKLNETEKQARAFAMVHYRNVPNQAEFVALMDRVAKARKWRGFQAKRFRMAVVEAFHALRAERG
jgi:hypothetical protein